MPDPIALVPLPQSVLWSSGVWTTTDPWEDLSLGLAEELAPTEYTLSIAPDGARLSAGSEAALADGRNTFAQIVTGSAGSIPCVTVHDRPAYAWRGMHLDVARHFFPIVEIETMIDAMALHRLNVLHLHLTDDQGWRVEVHGYPRLTEVGAWRDQTLIGHGGAPEDTWRFDGVRHGGYYTQDELRALVQYAAQRGVTIVPEIDLPGHMQAAVAAYPELGNFPEHPVGVREVWGISEHVLGVEDVSFDFVRDVLTQLADVFPGPYFHIGGDEVPVTEWERSPAAREKLNAWGLTRISEIQGRYTHFASEVLAEKGKRTVAWDEALESHLPDDTVVMNWRGEAGLKESLGRGFQTIVATSPHTYFDRSQSEARSEPLAIAGPTTLQDVYSADLLPSGLPEEQRGLVLGMQAQLWTEYIATTQHLQYMAYPRLAALAERAWGSPQQSYEEFEERLRAHLPRLDALGVRYRPLD